MKDRVKVKEEAVNETEQPKEEQKNEDTRFIGTVTVSFSPQPSVSLVFANGYKIGRFIEQWKKGGTPEEERGYSVAKGKDLVDALEAVLFGQTNFVVTLYGHDEKALIEEANKLSADIDSLAKSKEKISENISVLSVN